MTQRPSGWYDDPRDDEQLRYFDGVVWTEHTALKRPRRPQPPAQGPAGGSWPETGRPPAPGSASGGRPQAWGGGPSDHGRAPGWGPAPGGAPHGRAHRHGGAGADPARAQDGLRRAGWWRRVVAYVLDGFVTYVLLMPFVLPRADRITAETERLLAQIRAADGTLPAPSPELLQLAATLSLTSLVITLVYEVGMLAWRGATLGRMAVGIHVRRIGAPGPVPVSLGLRRSVVKYAASILGNVPVISFLAAMFQVVDYLWPLRDPRRQALHDKVVSTEVVRGRLETGAGGTGSRAARRSGLGGSAGRRGSRGDRDGDRDGGRSRRAADEGELASRSERESARGGDRPVRRGAHRR
ncbi:RDD family protein [Agilicoccus flavus]|uniref:RDD family protein n=1 Tax=Agilicoccus flavus TaxID=2775968 RepID=UPI001CF6E0B5|nr:RDD family protein [Agilicoccus flavus]